jgi:hypothetical protein
MTTSAHHGPRVPTRRLAAGCSRTSGRCACRQTVSSIPRVEGRVGWPSLGSLARPSRTRTAPPRRVEGASRPNSRPDGTAADLIPQFCWNFLCRPVARRGASRPGRPMRVRGTRLHALTSDGALRDRTRAWTHGQGACFATNRGAPCRGRGTLKERERETRHGDSTDSPITKNTPRPRRRGESPFDWPPKAPRRDESAKTNRDGLRAACFRALVPARSAG